MSLEATTLAGLTKIENALTQRTDRRAGVRMPDTIPVGQPMPLTTIAPPLVFGPQDRMQHQFDGWRWVVTYIRLKVEARNQQAYTRADIERQGTHVGMPGESLDYCMLAALGAAEAPGGAK